MNQQLILNLNLTEVSGEILTDTKNYLRNSNKLVDSNQNFPISIQSGTIYNIIDISNSLEVYKRIQTAADMAIKFDKPTPKQLSRSSSWLISKLLTKFNKIPTFVNAIFEGGIMLEYYLENDLYLMLEFFDDGEIVCLIKKDGIRKTYQKHYTEEFKSFLLNIIDAGSLQQSHNTNKASQKQSFI